MADRGLRKCPQKTVMTVIIVIEKENPIDKGI
jgi:hypothetical protein